MKTTRKLLLALVLVMSILMTLAVAVIPASAASVSGGTMVYLKPNNNWKSDGAWFAVYYWNSSSDWVKMTDPDGDGIYEAKIPSNNPNLIFCRMNVNDKNTLGWGNVWNQSSDLKTPTGTNDLYTVTEGAWSKGGGSWSAHTCNYYTKGATTKPTCTADGYTTYSCSCGKTTTKDTVSKTGHSWSNATCEAPKTCSVCKATEGDALGHSWSNATCTAPKTCSVCKATEGDALDHNYGEDGKDATCGACGHANPNACQHDWVDADCVLPKTCSKCGDTEGEPNGHEALKHVDAVAATCEAPGNLKYWYCEACGMATTVEGQELNTPVARMVTGATGHDMAAATCTAPSTCKNGCGLTVGEANGHSHTPSVTAPTCTADGYTTYTCACGDTYVDDEVAKLGHDMVTDEAKAPTCTETGLTEGSHCSRCSGATTKQETVPATGHNFVDGVCACSEKAYTIVYFQNNWKWSDVRVYYWDANEKSNASWPGQTITKIGTENGHDLYMVKVPAGTVGVIFNGKDGSTRKQTNDITNFENCYCHYMDWNEKDGDHSGSWKLHNHTLETVDPTCTEPGYTRYTCNGDTFTTVIPATKHTFTNYVPNDDATCCEDGTKTAKCENCDATDTQVDEGSSNMVDHTSWSEWYVSIPATCTEVGELERQCQYVAKNGEICGALDREEISIIPHAEYAECPHTAVDAEGNGFATLEDAIKAGAEVKLLGDVTISDDLKISNGAVLDLNGKTLTAEAIVTFNGSIIDTAGEGRIVVNNLQIAAGNYGYAPICVEAVEGGKSTYAITPVKVQTATTELPNVALVRPSLKGNEFTNKAIFAGELNHGITFALLVTRDNGVVSEDAYVSLENINLAQLYADNQHAIKITLKGGLEGYTYTVKFVVKSADTQVHVSDVIATRTVPVKPKEEIIPETTND